MATTIDPELRRRVQSGEYTVDPRAVAEAMLRRRDDLAAARRLSWVLVAGELDGISFRPDEPEAGAGVDAA
jgi:hypothetical protein